jgi:hypothetical protein
VPKQDKVILKGNERLIFKGKNVLMKDYLSKTTLGEKEILS